MKLRYSPTSPYVRKVSVAALELQLDDRIERVMTNPWAQDTDLPEDNPLGKVPALTVNEGNTYFDSRVICEYLDSLTDQPVLFPNAAERWQVLRLQSLSDGILDASVARFLEGKRKPARQSESWLSRQRATVHRALDTLEQEVSHWPADLNIGHIAAGCALGYVSFRFAEDNWEQNRPNLHAWYREFSQRPSMQATVPVAPVEG